LKREVDRGFDADLDSRLRDDKGRAARLGGADQRARRLEQMRTVDRSEAKEGVALRPPRSILESRPVGKVGCFEFERAERLAVERSPFGKASAAVPVRGC